MNAHGSREQTLRAWLALLHTYGLGNRTLYPLLDEHSPEQLLTNPPESLPAEIRETLRHPPTDLIDRDLEWLAQDNNQIVCLSDPDYPALLRLIPDPPLLLFIHGNPDVLALPQLAMVGSRNPTSGGLQTARDFARHLAEGGFAITSGLALGIDAAAHEGALKGNGITLAVTGTGLDRVYPARHHQLAHAIAEQGALISEFPPGTPPKAENFPRRNRIIAGLSLGTLVVEAALRSGSLITARLASEQGREVFAIPGSIHNPLARGCHALIRQGAKLVETAQDILEELGAITGAMLPEDETADVPAAAVALDEEHRQLLDTMGYDPLTMDEIVTRSGLTAPAVSSMLLILELDGLVKSQPGGRFLRSDKRA